MQERKYQDEAEVAIFREWEKARSTLLVMATGTGKTIVFCRVTKRLVTLGARVLIMAHRDELLKQAAAKLAKSTGLGCSREKAEETCIGEWYRVVVGSVQTLMSEKRLARFSPDYFDAVIVDEAHRTLADGYLRILAHFAKAKVLGVTATPDRGDMRDLGTFYETLAYEYSLPRAIKEGFLVPIRAMTLPLTLDISGLKKKDGDFTDTDVANALDPYLRQIAELMAAHCADRMTVVFLPLVATAQKFCQMLIDAGLRAVEVNGESKGREEILEAFGRRRYNVICNAMLLTEGWDEPQVDCVVCLRPTTVRALYAQMIGRGTRPSPETGKEFLLLLDFLWMSERMDLCRPAHLIAEESEVAAIMTANMAAATGCPMDLMESERGAAGDAMAAREEALAERLAAMKQRKKGLVDPLQYEMSIQGMNLSSYKPAFGWEMEKPSADQVKALEGAGILPDAVDNAGKAKLILDTVEARKAAGMATAKQIRTLERYGFKHVGGWSQDQAGAMFARLAANRWSPPNGVVPSTYVPPAPKRSAELAWGTI